ncbi:type II toxin-antitoxin system CcdA family antitoxin, partial [Salmonella enterica]
MKQRITVTVDSDSYQLLKAYDVNISGLVVNRPVLVPCIF